MRGDQGLWRRLSEFERRPSSYRLSISIRNGWMPEYWSLTVRLSIRLYGNGRFAAGHSLCRCSQDLGVIPRIARNERGVRGYAVACA
jgi:hypothetical protein